MLRGACCVSTCVPVYLYTRTAYCVLRNVKNDFVCFRRIAGAVDEDAVLLHVGDELRQVFIETGDHVRFDGVGAGAAFRVVGDGSKGGLASLAATLGVGVEGGLQVFIGNGLADFFSKYSHNLL